MRRFEKRSHVFLETGFAEITKCLRDTWFEFDHTQPRCVNTDERI